MTPTGSRLRATPNSWLRVVRMPVCSLHQGLGGFQPLSSCVPRATLLADPRRAAAVGSCAHRGCKPILSSLERQSILSCTTAVPCTVQAHASRQKPLAWQRPPQRSSSSWRTARMAGCGYGGCCSPRLGWGSTCCNDILTAVRRHLCSDLSHRGSVLARSSFTLENTHFVDPMASKHL